MIMILDEESKDFGALPLLIVSLRQIRREGRTEERQNEVIVAYFKIFK
jgi:hypothetical protein